MCPALRKDAYMQGTHAELKKANAGKTACSYSPLSWLEQRQSFTKAERLPSSAGMGPACRRRDKQVGEQKHANPAVSPPDHTSCLPTRWPVCSTSIVAHHTRLLATFPTCCPTDPIPRELGALCKLSSQHLNRNQLAGTSISGGRASTGFSEASEKKCCANA